MQSVLDVKGVKRSTNRATDRSLAGKTKKNGRERESTEEREREKRVERDELGEMGMGLLTLKNRTQGYFGLLATKTKFQFSFLLLQKSCKRSLLIIKLYSNNSENFKSYF